MSVALQDHGGLPVALFPQTTEEPVFLAEVQGSQRTSSFRSLGRAQKNLKFLLACDGGL